MVLAGVGRALGARGAPLGVLRTPSARSFSRTRGFLRDWDPWDDLDAKLDQYAAHAARNRAKVPVNGSVSTEAPTAKSATDAQVTRASRRLPLSSLRPDQHPLAGHAQSDRSIRDLLDNEPDGLNPFADLDAILDGEKPASARNTRVLNQSENPHSSGDTHMSVRRDYAEGMSPFAELETIFRNGERVPTETGSTAEETFHEKRPSAGEASWPLRGSEQSSLSPRPSGGSSVIARVWVPDAVAAALTGEQPIPHMHPGNTILDMARAAGALAAKRTEHWVPLHEAHRLGAVDIHFSVQRTSNQEDKVGISQVSQDYIQQWKPTDGEDHGAAHGFSAENLIDPEAWLAARQYAEQAVPRPQQRTDQEPGTAYMGSDWPATDNGGRAGMHSSYILVQCTVQSTKPSATEAMAGCMAACLTAYDMLLGATSADMISIDKMEVQT